MNQLSSRRFVRVSPLHNARLTLTCASSLFALVVASQAFAQSAPPPAAAPAPIAQPSSDAQDSAAAGAAAVGDTSTSTNGDIIVTGIIGSLTRNLAIKRTSPGVVDVISSEDIGKFPDSNVASALQRLPGVGIQRSGSRGEATGVSIRGFGGDFVRTLNDGRQLSTATGGRGVDFSTVGADFVGQLAVYKTPDVELTTSAIGGTIDVSLPKPFDREGFHVAATASGSLQSRNDRLRPTAGLLVSSTSADGKFGILADFAYSRRDTTSNETGVLGWVGIKFYPCQLTAACTPTDFTPAKQETRPSWFPQRSQAEQDETRDERVDARIAAQWRPSESILVTLDNNFSQQALNGENAQYTAWFQGQDLRNVKRDSSGTVIDFNQFGTPMDIISTRFRNTYRTNQTGLNLKWKVAEHLSLDLDGAYSKSKRNPGRNGRNDTMFLGYGGTNPGGPFVSQPCTFPDGAAATTAPTSCATYGTVLGANTGLSILGPSSRNFPQIHDYGPAGVAANHGNRDFIGSHVIVRGSPYNTDTVKQLRGSLRWDSDNLKLVFGGQYIEDRFYGESQNSDAAFASRAGYGPLSGRPGGLSGGLTTLPADVYIRDISTKNFIPGYSDALAPKLVLFNPYKVFDLLEANGGGSVAPALNPGSILTVTEKTLGIFFKANFESEIAGMPLRISTGIRNEGTNVSTVALGRQLLGLERPLTDPSLLQASGYSTAQPIIAKSNYNYLLPSIDVKLDITPNLILRADASRTLTRPALADLTPTINPTSLRIGSLSAVGGNPNLKPYLADNYDIAAEWYYKPNSYFAVNAFLKQITDYIVGGVSVQGLNDVIDPTTGKVAQFNVNLRVNGPKATVRGVEVALQHVFGNSGFGFNANATIPSTNRNFDSSDVSGAAFAIPGLGKSANFVGFYDKHRFQIRGAVNWRDEYLLAIGQPVGGTFGAEPVYVNRQLQVDASASYDVASNFTLFGEVTNINNSTYSTHGRFDNQTLDVWSYGRRYTAGVRIRY